MTDIFSDEPSIFNPAQKERVSLDTIFLTYEEFPQPKFWFEKRDNLNGKDRVYRIAKGEELKIYIEGPIGNKNRYVIKVNMVPYVNPIKDKVVDVQDTKKEAIKSAYEHALIVKSKLLEQFPSPFVDDTPFAKPSKLEASVKA
jgi:hypothetical protein